jgi:hypothetical protein
MPRHALRPAVRVSFAALVLTASALTSGARAVHADGGTFGTFDVPGIGSMVVTPDGSILGSDLGNGRIYRVSPSGEVSVFAGAGPGGFTNGYSGDGGPAIDAHFGGILGLAWAPDGSLLVVDHLNDVIRRIDSRGIVTTIAGSGPLYKWSHGFWRPGIRHTGDGGPATDAILDAPWDIGVSPAGDLYIADRDHDAIRRVDADGILTTVAGTGQRGYNGDGIAATDAKLSRPGSVAFPAGGGFLIADENNSRIRRVDPAGRISTFAGNGKLGCFGDGGPASAASLQNVGSMLILDDGTVLAVQGECQRVRAIGPDGIVRTFAGNGGDTCGEVDGALATSVAMNPGGLARAANGDVLISDGACQLVIRVDSTGHIHIAADLRGLGG